ASAIRDKLLRIVSPRRPERSPELSVFLSRMEMEEFAIAIEDLAEGRHRQAVHQLSQLRQRHPSSLSIDAAIAACEIFAGRIQEARDLLLRVEESGSRISGSSLWNLAYTQIFLGDLPAA